MNTPAGPRNVVHLMTGLFARFFPLPSWRMHVLCAAAIFGLCYGLSEEDAADVLRCLGRSVLPTTPAERVALVIGRRGGKSRFASFLLVYLACFRDYSAILTPGERAVAMLVAPDRRQARTCFRYVEAFIDQTPMLASMVVARTKETISLSNGIDIEVHTASFRSVRGVTVVACIIDEAAFLPTDDSADPDRELIAALLPAMATVPGALLMMISSPYARRGELWRAYHEHFGKDADPFLVFQASTETMNPSVDKRLIQAAYAEDEAVASAEYGGLFRRDIEQFVSREVLDAVTVPDRRELPFTAGLSAPLPPSLRLLERVLKFSRRGGRLDAALPFAREMLTTLNLDDTDAHVDAFIHSYWTDDSAYAGTIEYLDSDEFAEVTHPIGNGDIAVALTEPAIALGVALAYVLLAEGGA